MYLALQGILSQDQGAKSILFVVSDDVSPVTTDASIKSYLEGEGYTVTYQEDSSAVAGDADGHDLILVSTSVSSSALGTTFRDSSVALLEMEYLLFDDDYLISGSSQTDSGETQINITNSTHAITSGVFSTGLIDVVDTGTYNNRYAQDSNLGGGATVIADSPGGSTRASIVVYDSGDAVAGFGTAPARRIMFGVESTYFDDYSTDMTTLFLQAVKWGCNQI